MGHDQASHGGLLLAVIVDGGQFPDLTAGLGSLDHSVETMTVAGIRQVGVSVVGAMRHLRDGHAHRALELFAADLRLAHLLEGEHGGLRKQDMELQDALMIGVGLDDGHMLRLGREAGLVLHREVHDQLRLGLVQHLPEVVEEDLVGKLLTEELTRLEVTHGREVRGRRPHLAKHHEALPSLLLLLGLTGETKRSQRTQRCVVEIDHLVAALQLGNELDVALVEVVVAPLLGAELRSDDIVGQVLKTGGVLTRRRLLRLRRGRPLHRLPDLRLAALAGLLVGDRRLARTMHQDLVDGRVILERDLTRPHTDAVVETAEPRKGANDQINIRN